MFGSGLFSSLLGEIPTVFHIHTPYPRWPSLSLVFYKRGSRRLSAESLRQPSEVSQFFLVDF